MSEVNDAFCHIMLQEAKKELRAKLGWKNANKLIRENMDVSGSKSWGYALHWVKDGDIIQDDLYKEKRCGNIDEARAEAIYFLVEKLNANPPCYQASQPAGGE